MRRERKGVEGWVRRRRRREGEGWIGLRGMKMRWRRSGCGGEVSRVKVEHLRMGLLM